MDLEKRARLDRNNERFRLELERAIERGELGENPTESQRAAWVAKRKSVEKAKRYNRDNYEHMNFSLKKDPDANGGLTGAVIRSAAAASKMSINEFIVTRLREGMDAAGEINRDGGGAVLFLPEEDPVSLEGSDAQLVRDLAERLGADPRDCLLRAVRELADRNPSRGGFWRDRE